MLAVSALEHEPAPCGAGPAPGRQASSLRPVPSIQQAGGMRPTHAGSLCHGAGASPVWGAGPAPGRLASSAHGNPWQQTQVSSSLSECAPCMVHAASKLPSATMVLKATSIYLKCTAPLPPLLLLLYYRTVAYCTAAPCALILPPLPLPTACRYICSQWRRGDQPGPAAIASMWWMSTRWSDSIAMHVRIA